MLKKIFSITLIGAILAVGSITFAQENIVVAKAGASKKKMEKKERITFENVIDIVHNAVPNGKLVKIEKDGKKYEVELLNGDQEQSMEINAFTGEIIEFKTDDDRSSLYSDGEPRISFKEAYAIAMDNLARDKFDEIELKKENNFFIYKVKISEGLIGKKLIKIDATTGGIISSNSEF